MSSLLRLRLLLLPLVLLVVGHPSRAAAQLHSLETDDLRLIWLHPIHTYLVPHVARSFHNSMAFQRRAFDYESNEKVTVILSDYSDLGNAGAGAVPRNGLAVMIAPLAFTYETYPANERMNTLMNHELVHVVNYDRAAGSEHFFRSLFGGKVRAVAEHPETILYNYLTAPRASAPRWYHEGIAVFVETWMAGGIGRAQGSYDEMVFRSMVRDGTEFYDPLGLVSEGTQTDFQLEMNSYLYGTRFMSWLAYENSPDALLQWVTRTEGSEAYHGAQFERVFGQSLDEAWEQWVDFEHDFQQANLDSLRRYPMTPYRDVSERALGSVSRAWHDVEAGRIYAALNYPGRVPHVASIELTSGEVESLVDVKGAVLYSVTSLAFDPGKRRLYYTTDNSAYRDLVELDPDTGDTRVLMEDARIGDIVVDPSDGAIWGIRHMNGIATLVRVPRPYREWNQIVSLDYGTIPYDLDVSPDGSRVAAAFASPSGRAEVRVLDADSLRTNGTMHVLDRFDFGTTIPMNFVFTPDGDHMIGSSNLTGVSNLFRYDLRADRWEALTNTETGLFRPVPVSADSVIAFRFTGEGFVPSWLEVEPLEDLSAITFLGARLVERHPELESWRVGSPAEVPLDTMISYRGEYPALSSLELESIYPVVEGYKDYAAAGLRMDLGDPLGLHRFHFTGSYTPDGRLDADERLHGEASYRRYDWRVRARYNDADFYDLFGPTKSSRKGYSLAVGWTRNLIDDSPRSLDFHVDVAGWGGLETLPDYQNVSASYEELLTGTARLDWSDLRFSIGAVDYEKGTKASLQLSDNHVNDRSFPSLVGELHAGVPGVLPNSSWWVRTAAGVAPADRDEPFSNFFLGGFGNNWVDHGETKRYREWYAFPGFDLNELGGTNFVKAMVDWNLPPLRFRRAGRPAFYASWVRTSLFGAGLLTNVDAPDLRTEALSLGAQLDLRMTLLSHLRLTASVGYAVGLRDGRRADDELMFSLKIL